MKQVLVVVVLEHFVPSVIVIDNVIVIDHLNKLFFTFSNIKLTY